MEFYFGGRGAGGGWVFRKIGKIGIKIVFTDFEISTSLLMSILWKGLNM